MPEDFKVVCESSVVEICMQVNFVSNSMQKSVMDKQGTIFRYLKEAFDLAE